MTHAEIPGPATAGSDVPGGGRWHALPGRLATCRRERYWRLPCGDLEGSCGDRDDETGR